VIAPKVPAGGIREFIAYAKANPGKLNFASAGIGTSAHIAAEIFNQAAGIQGVHVPFKLMADVYTAMLADQVQYYVFVLPTALPMLRDGKLRALAVTSSKRNAALPDVPTVVEAGLPEAQSSAWFGVVAPTGTPRKIIVRLHTDIVRILRESETRKRFNVQGADASVDTTPDAFKSLIKSEYARYQKLIRDIDLKPQ
jgi:tripartite-type tricarboxylate transporter receptor subunit TctC